MKRRFLIPFFVAAFALAIGGACKKKEEGGEGEPAAAKPAEGDKKEEAKKEEPKDEEKKEEAKDEGGDTAGKTGVAECDEYVAAVNKYVECDKVPQQARDATKQGLEQMNKAWSQWGDDVPDATKKAAADGCKTALDALKKGAEAIGCPLE